MIRTTIITAKWTNPNTAVLNAIMQWRTPNANEQFNARLDPFVEGFMLPRIGYTNRHAFSKA